MDLWDSILEEYHRQVGFHREAWRVLLQIKFLGGYYLWNEENIRGGEFIPQPPRTANLRKEQVRDRLPCKATRTDNLNHRLTYRRISQSGKDCNWLVAYSFSLPPGYKEMQKNEMSSRMRGARNHG